MRTMPIMIKMQHTSVGRCISISSGDARAQSIITAMCVSDKWMTF